MNGKAPHTPQPIIPKKSSFLFGTDGSGFNDLIVKNSATNYNKNLTPEIFMDGKKVLMFTMANTQNLFLVY